MRPRTLEETGRDIPPFVEQDAPEQLDGLFDELAWAASLRGAWDRIGRDGRRNVYHGCQCIGSSQHINIVSVGYRRDAGVRALPS